MTTTTTPPTRMRPASPKVAIGLLLAMLLLVAVALVVTLVRYPDDPRVDFTGTVVIVDGGGRAISIETDDGDKIDGLLAIENEPPQAGDAVTGTYVEGTGVVYVDPPQ